uniref:Gag-like protein n=1 Tax=Anopheles gambiae TaxID=7165 RepID=Q868R7_ANOGA|nr:gag-like protein [Anopheles gambiae]
MEARKQKPKKNVEDEEHERLIEEFISKLKKSYKKASKAEENEAPRKVSHKAQLERFKNYANNLEIEDLRDGMIAQMIEFMESMIKEMSELKKQLKQKSTQEIEVQTAQPSELAEDAPFVPQTRKGRVPKEARKRDNNARQRSAQRETPKSSGGQSKQPKKKKKKRSLPKPEAVVIEKCENIDLAKVLKGLTHDDALKDVGDQVAKVRRTQNGDMLLVLKRGKEAVRVEAGIKNALKDKANVRTLAPSVMIEITHLDEITLAEEIAEALKQQLEIDVDHKEIKVREARTKGTQKATFRVPLSAKERVLNPGKLKVGWCVCSLREATVQVKCFKCWKLGHKGFECTGQDRSKLCIKCGQEGHKIRECPNAMTCLDCREDMVEPHITGSLRCPNRIARRQQHG